MYFGRLKGLREVGGFSRGLQQKVAIAAALIPTPRRGQRVRWVSPLLGSPAQDRCHNRWVIGPCAKSALFLVRSRMKVSPAVPPQPWPRVRKA